MAPLCAGLTGVSLHAQNFEAVPKGAGHMHDQSFREMRHMAAGQAEQRSFEAEVAKELYRLANAPASEYEVSTDRRLRRLTDPAEGS